MTDAVYGSDSFSVSVAHNPAWYNIRARHPAADSIRSVQYLPHDAKLQTLLSIMEGDTCKSIASSMDLRTFLVSQPKNMD